MAYLWLPAGYCGEFLADLCCRSVSPAPPGGLFRTVKVRVRHDALQEGSQDIQQSERKPRANPQTLLGFQASRPELVVHRGSSPPLWHSEVKHFPP